VEWTDFFKIRVLRETLQGPHLYFQSELKIPSQFSREELSLDEFNHLHLSDIEKKLFSISYRKLYLRHRFFRTPEFDRITENFAERIATEKEQLLTFSTHAGGVYLFLNLMKQNHQILQEKKIICYTSEPPLQMMAIGQNANDRIHIILHPHKRSYFKDFPSLWDKSGLIDLYRAYEA
jgi:hypothetical protein